MTDVPEVLFVCVHNAGRSQMAAGLLDHYAEGRVIVRSAGSAPVAEINPAVVTVMAEVGVDLAKAFPKPLTDEMARAADVIVTMGCGDACPVHPGKRYLDWQLADPAGRDVDAVRAIRDDIDRRVRALLAELVPASAVATPDRAAIEEAVRAHYAAAALRSAGGGDGERRSAACQPGIGAGCYEASEVEGLPAAAVAASIGCANPVAVADLVRGEVVLDLGSGGGIDVLLSARRVGPTGKAYGLDMTDEMLDLARAHQADAGITNAEFLKGTMEAIPLPDASVDVVLSNCVIALAVDKGRVLSETLRVLRPGGRFAVADVVADNDQSPEQPSTAEAWVSCVSGALTEGQYRKALRSAGFAGVVIDASHAVMDGFTSVIVRASKPYSNERHA